MAHLSIRIPDAELALLKAEAARQNREVSHIVREAIRAISAPATVEPTQVARAGAIAARHGLRTTQILKLCLDFALDVFESGSILKVHPKPEVQP